MWLLVLVLLAPVAGFDTVQKIGTFLEEAACQRERNRIGFDMAEAYPETRDFVIECRYRPEPAETL